MDASSATVFAAASGSSADEANFISPFSPSSLPPSQYLQTCPHLLTSANNSSTHHPPTVRPIGVVPMTSDQSCRSLHSLDFNVINNNNNDRNNSCIDNSEYRRQSLKGDAFSRVMQINSCNTHPGELDFTNSSRSTSSPQLMCLRTRSKVYRRASLKSLTNINSMSPAQSRIIKVSSGRGKNEKRLLQVEVVASKSNDKENAGVVRNPYPYSTPVENNGKLGEESVDGSDLHHRHLHHHHHHHSSSSSSSSSSSKSSSSSSSNHSHRDVDKQQAKSKSYGSSFLPILSLIPHTVISFQYPSPKMKFSWWRNKIS